MCFNKCGEPQVSKHVKALWSRTELSFFLLIVLSWVSVQRHKKFLEQFKECVIQVYFVLFVAVLFLPIGFGFYLES